MQVLIVSLGSLFLIGCSSLEERMYSLAVPTTKLSSTVAAAVRYEGVPPDLNEDELIRRATEHDPTLMAPFKEYKVRAMAPDRHAVVLVCTKDGRQGLLEDAACTDQFDAHHWKTRPDLPCAFTLRPAQICR